jgi:hypothetical protein
MTAILWADLFSPPAYLQASVYKVRTIRIKHSKVCYNKDKIALTSLEIRDNYNFLVRTITL